MPPHQDSSQKAIWDYFQNQNPESFAQASSRYLYLLRKVRKGSRTLNIGIGGGGLEQLALARGIDIHAIDPDEKATKTLSERLNLGEKVRTAYSDSIPFADAYFDSVVATEVLEHLDAEQRGRTLCEIKRVLRPGGAFLGTVPANEDLKLAMVVCPHCSKVFHKWGHQVSFSKELLAAELRAHFSTVDVAQHWFVGLAGQSPVNRILEIVKVVLHRLKIRRSQSNLVFRCTKP